MLWAFFFGLLEKPTFFTLIGAKFLLFNLNMLLIALRIDDVSNLQHLLFILVFLTTENEIILNWSLESQFNCSFRARKTKPKLKRTKPKLTLKAFQMAFSVVFFVFSWFSCMENKIICVCVKVGFHNWNPISYLQRLKLCAHRVVFLRVLYCSPSSRD